MTHDAGFVADGDVRPLMVLSGRAAGALSRAVMIVTAVSLALTLAGCGDAGSSSSAGANGGPSQVGGGAIEPATPPVLVTVSVAPHGWLVEQVGGDLVDVAVLVSPGQSPATYSPSDAQISRVMKSRVLFRCGVPFENGAWFDALSRAKSLLRVDLRQGIDMRAMADHSHGEPMDGHAPHMHHDHADHQSHDHADHDSHDHADHDSHDHADRQSHDHPAEKARASHKGQHDHPADAPSHTCASCSTHGGGDPHIWTSPHLLITQARTVAEALTRLMPDHAATIQANLEKTVAQLEQLDRRIARTLEPAAGRPFFVFHPAWGYFADRYGLKQVAVEVQGKEPSDAQITRLQQQMRQVGKKVVFVQPQITGRSAQLIAQAVGGQTQVLDPLSPDVIENLREVADRIAAAVLSRAEVSTRP